MRSRNVPGCRRKGQRKEIAEFLAGHRGDAGAAAFTMELQEEIRHYREHGRFYGYVFYIGQRPGT